MSYKSAVESMRAEGNNLKGRSDSFRNVYDRLVAFDTKLGNTPDDKKFESFASDEMKDLLESCDKYIKSHHPLTKSGKEQLNKMKELRAELMEMRLIGKSVVEYDKYVKDNIVEPMATAERQVSRHQYADARTTLMVAHDRATDDLKSKAHDLNITLDNAYNKWGYDNFVGSSVFVADTVNIRVRNQEAYAQKLENQTKALDSMIAEASGPKKEPEKGRVKTSFSDLAKPASSFRTRKAPEPARTREPLEKKGPAMGK